MREEARNEPRAERRSRKGRATELDVFAGRRLREARLAVRMTQEELGKALGLSFQAIQKYESGENRLSVGRRHDAVRGNGKREHVRALAVDVVRNAPGARSDRDRSRIQSRRETPRLAARSSVPVDLDFVRVE